MKSLITTRSIILDGHKTSISLEESLWREGLRSGEFLARHSRTKWDD